MLRLDVKTLFLEAFVSTKTSIFIKHFREETKKTLAISLPF